MPRCGIKPFRAGEGGGVVWQTPLTARDAHTACVSTHGETFGPYRLRQLSDKPGARDVMNFTARKTRRKTCLGFI